MVPPSFTSDSRLPPHQQHRDTHCNLLIICHLLLYLLLHLLLHLFIAWHVNVCQSVAAYLRSPYILLLNLRIYQGSFLRSVRSSEMYSSYAESCASHQPAAFCFPRISLLVLFYAFFVSVAYTTPSSLLLSRSFSYSICISINPCGGAVTPADFRSFASNISFTCSGV